MTDEYNISHYSLLLRQRYYFAIILSLHNKAFGYRCEITHRLSEKTFIVRREKKANR